jgi:molybdenum cofactor cytidylyltransferase
MTIMPLILAAGESRRMGTPKPLLPLGETTVLERVTELFTLSGISTPRVVIGHGAKEIRCRFPDLQVAWVHNPGYEEGMFSSIKAGLSDLPQGVTSFFLLPADIPLVRRKTMGALIAAWNAKEAEVSILFPAFRGERGHPPLISARHIPDILAWNGEGGLQGFLNEHEGDARDIPVVDEFILRDMDTPKDSQALADAFSRYDAPTLSECEALLSDPAFFSEKTAAHCRMTATVSAALSRKLGIPDPGPIITAALLHDIAKGEKDHAGKGAILLRDLGFSGIADLVESHMALSPSESGPLSGQEIVYLSDKLVKNNIIVSLSERFGEKLRRHGDDPLKREAILKRQRDAELLVRRFEEETGTSLQTFMEDVEKGIA